MAEDLLQQKFTPPASTRCRAADITYILTTSGWSYLAVWMDLFSSRVVGWSLGASMEASQVLEALHGQLAIGRSTTTSKFKDNIEQHLEPK